MEEMSFKRGVKETRTDQPVSQHTRPTGVDGRRKADPRHRWDSYRSQRCSDSVQIHGQFYAGFA